MFIKFEGNFQILLIVILNVVFESLSQIVHITRINREQQFSSVTNKMKVIERGLNRESYKRKRGYKMARFEQQESQLMAATGAADTLYHLGMMYCIGREVEMDLVTAHKWFNLAALRGNEEAKQVRTEISVEMTSQEIAEAQRQARSWLQLH